MAYLEIPTVFTYTFSRGKLRPYLGVGVVNAFLLEQNKDFILTSFHANYGQTFPGYMIGSVVKAGIKYRLHERQFLSLEGAYCRLLHVPHSYNDDKALFMYNNQFNINIGYSFKL